MLYWGSPLIVNCSIITILNFTFQMKDVLKMHKQICPSKPTMLQLSLDGVQEAVSSLVSVDTYSICFNDCRNIYPIRIIRPVNKAKFDEYEHLASVVGDINENDILIHTAVFDRLKRNFAKCIMSHSSYYACEYCECPAFLLITKNKDKNNTEGKTKKQLVWPYGTINGKPRELQEIRRIAERIQNEGPLPREEAKGITGKSIFLDQPRFHYIKDMPCEYLHLLCLGVIKRTVELTFRVGENRDRQTKRKLSDPQLFNDFISAIQVVREFGRRCRNLDFSVFKAQEYRNIGLFFFILVIKCIEPSHTDEIKLWYYLAFMIRSCVLPNSEFRNLPDKLVSNACNNFYRLFQKLYGKINCSYSIHVASSHLLQIRGTQPLTFRSAFKFESFFAEMKKMYVPGTVSTTKQVLRNCYMKRAVEHHVCEKTIFYDVEKTTTDGKPSGLENNSLIYITDEDNNHNMYKIIKLNKDNNNEFTCVKQGKFQFKTPLIPSMNWSQVGVYKLGPTIEEQHHIIFRNDISGKVLKVDNCLITCPSNVLQEK